MRAPLNPADYSAALAATVRCRREAAGLSQNQLSAASGVSRTMLTHVERGMRFPTVDFLCRLACGLRTTPARILAQAERELKKSATFTGSARFIRQRAAARSAGR
ncbi:MAG: helix-turn-helix domain-containing protein [Opitutaceae bacterium]|nr:helix-turn-helix domain-containing protein [Opitutaceae bacterium]